MTNGLIKNEEAELMLKDIYKDINFLIQKNLTNNTFPYLSDKPLPQDVNVVNGRHLGDINKITLELKAASIGSKSLKWIYAADADFMNLELKKDQAPLMCYANIINGKELHTEAQKAYLLDQFTDISIENAINISRDEKADKQKKTISQNMIKNITEYDSGLGEKNLRENKRKNISINLKEKEIVKLVQQAFNNVTSNYTPEQKNIFVLLNNYFVQQETGISIQKLSKEQKEQALNTIKEMSLVDSPKLTQLFAESFLYSERITHLGFEQNRIISKDDLKKSLEVFAPKAAAFEPKPSHKIEKEKEVEIEREMDIKPRQITHDRRR